MRPNFISKLINIAGIVASIYLLVILVQTVRGNASLQNQNDQLQRDIEQLKQDNNNLSYQIEYYKTDAYKEKAAREKLALQKPGEHVIIFPNSKSPTEAAGQPPTQPKTKQDPNWVQWWHFLFG